MLRHDNDLIMRQYETCSSDMSDASEARHRKKKILLSSRWISHDPHSGAQANAFAAAKLQVKPPLENMPRAKRVLRFAALASASASNSDGTRHMSYT